jgi:cyclohexyl-isocyanide hydratase
MTPSRRSGYGWWVRGIGNRMTGGGVTGLDFALALVAEMRGEKVARRVQLTIEDAPDPLFKNGTPVEPGTERTAEMPNSRKCMDGQARLAVEQAARRLGIRVSS